MLKSKSGPLAARQAKSRARRVVIGAVMALIAFGSGCGPSDAQYERMAKEFHNRLKKGMSLGTLLELTESIAESQEPGAVYFVEGTCRRGQWSVYPSSRPLGDLKYVVFTVALTESGLGSEQLRSKQEVSSFLREAIPCESVAVTFGGHWRVATMLDGEGRVAAYSVPSRNASGNPHKDAK